MIKFTTSIEARSFPKSIVIAEIEDRLQALGLTALSTVYLRDNFGVETLDELLNHHKMYQYVEDMLTIIDVAETDGL